MGNDAAKKWQDRWGGFVHPHPVLNTKDGAAYYDATPGMTLRDWFAGQALAAIISKNPLMGRPGSPENGREEVSGPLASAIQKSIAFGAYEYADAMIAARKGGDA